MLFCFPRWPFSLCPDTSKIQGPSARWLGYVALIISEPIYGTTVLCGHDSQLSAVLISPLMHEEVPAAQTRSWSPYLCSHPAVCLVKQGSRTGSVSSAASGSWMLWMLTSPCHGGCGQCREIRLYVWKMWLPALYLYPWLCAWVSAALGELISPPFRGI